MSETVKLMNWGIYLNFLDKDLLRLEEEKSKNIGNPHEYIKLQAVIDQTLIIRNKYKELVLDPISCSS
jgi:hypothetical protein